MRPDSVFRITSDNLKGVIAVYASAWVSEAVRYRRPVLHAQSNERAFWLGMSNGFEDSADQLIRLLNQPTVSRMFNFVRVLEHCRAYAEYYQDGLADHDNLMAYTSGVAEAYKTCGDYMADLSVEVMLSATVRLNYLS